MANKKVTVAEVKKGEKWFNIKDNNGVEYGIMVEKNPKLIAQLQNIQAGGEVEGNHTDKDGKNFLWDPRDNSSNNGKGNFVPKDPRIENARTAALAASNMLFSKDPTPDKFDALAEHVFNWIQSKKSA